MSTSTARSVGEFVAHPLIGLALIAIVWRAMWPLLAQLAGAPYSSKWIASITGAGLAMLMVSWTLWVVAAGIAEWIFRRNTAEISSGN